VGEIALNFGGRIPGSKALSSEADWEKNNIKGEKMPGWEYGFHHVKEKREKWLIREKIMDELEQEVGIWLRKKCFV
jgi:hypothetical protein